MIPTMAVLNDYRKRGRNVLGRQSCSTAVVHINAITMSRVVSPTDICSRHTLKLTTSLSDRWYRRQAVFFVCLRYLVAVGSSYPYHARSTSTSLEYNLVHMDMKTRTEHTTHTAGVRV